MSEKPGMQFVGLARELHQELAADDVVAYDQMGRIALPFMAMIRSHTVPRPAMLARAATNWRERIPSTGRLKLEVELRQKSLHIRELRVLAADSRFFEWPADVTEPGLSLSAVRLEVSSRFRFEPVTLATVGMHAVSRWFQRNFKNTRAALMADLATLAGAVTDARLAAGGDFEVRAGDGRWVGRVAEVEDQGSPMHILAVRSFLS